MCIRVALQVWAAWITNWMYTPVYPRGERERDKKPVRHTLRAGFLLAMSGPAAVGNPNDEI
jgi:hypothetical protein